MTATMTPERSGRSPEADGKDSFGRLVHAEWTKFRTVRGWVIAMVIAAALTAAVGLYAASGPQTGCQPTGPNGPIGPPAPCKPSNPVGPGGEAVSDGYYFVHQALRGNGSITVRVTSLTGRSSPPGGGIAPGREPGAELHQRPPAVGQGRDHRHREHPAGVGVRGDDGHRPPRRADAVRLHRRHAGPARGRVRRLAALAAAGTGR